MNILILTGKFGMGHCSAARSLQAKFCSEEPAAQVEVVDLLSYAMPNASEAFYKGFSLLVTYGSGIFNTYYRLTEHLDGENNLFYDLLFLSKLRALLREKEPDLVVATHPMCANLVARYKEETLSTVPLVTCITGLSVHPEWINRKTDLYLVGTPSLAEQLAEKGVERSRILPTGIPVRGAFATTPKDRGGAVRRLLIMGGGLGLMPKKDKFYEELNALEGVETTIIAGHNEKLRERLEGKYEHIEVVGYTERVYDYMARADLMLSKPGGITLFEAIASELPILAWEPFLQQEINNAHFMTAAGIGQVAAKGTEDCLAAIRRLIYDPAGLSAMAERMRELKDCLAEDWLEDILSRVCTKKGACA